MEKLISKIDISHDVANGTTNLLIICSNCKHKIFTTSRYKFMYQKIKVIECPNCRHTIKIGNIFNFKYGTKLNHTNKRYNQQTLDDYIWYDNYDKI